MRDRDGRARLRGRRFRRSTLRARGTRQRRRLRGVALRSTCCTLSRVGLGRMVVPGMRLALRVVVVVVVMFFTGVRAK